MRRPVRTRPVRPRKAKRQAARSARRDHLAVLLALVTVVCLDLVFFLSKDTQFLQFLMPGPLTSAHASIENCSAARYVPGRVAASLQSAVMIRFWALPRKTS